MNDHSVPAKSWLSLFMRLNGHFTILVALAGICVCVISVFAFDKASRLRADSVEIMVRIDEKIWRSRGTSNGSSVYELGYTFQASDGSTLTQRTSVSSEFYLAVSEGDVVPLRYDPSDPTINEIEPGANSKRGVVALLVGIAVTFLGAFLTWIKGKHASLAIRTRDTGQRLQAEVTELKVTDSKSTQTEIHWRDQNGNSGKSMPMPKAIAEQYLPGSSVTVFTGGASGENTFWLGDVGEPPTI